MQEPSRWTAAAESLGRDLESGDSVTFVLGAGCSRSSNAPSVREVNELLGNAFGARLGARGFRDLHQVPMSQRVAALRRRFDDVHPYLGYRFLAALGSARLIVVLNFNWDDALPEACRLVGVDCEPVDIADVTTSDWRPDLTDRGIVDIHLHGMLPLSARHGPFETASFTESGEAVIRRYLEAATVVTTGTTLDDIDYQRSIGNLTNRAAPGEPHWYFGRATGDPNELLRRAAAAGASEQTYWEEESLEFDEVMLHVAAGYWRRSWADFRHEVKIDLPELANLVWPRPDLIRPLLDARLVALPGNAKLGKTTVALFLAYCFTLMSEENSAVKHFGGPAVASAAVGNVGIDDDLRVMVVEDPFGSGRSFERNPPFLKTLKGMRTDAARVLVTSRLSHWFRGIGDSDTTPLAIADASPAEWYERKDLEEFARSLGTSLPVQIDARNLDTPARILHFKDLRDRGKWYSARPIDVDAEAVADRVSLLAAARDLAMLCAHVRLQEYAGSLPEAAEVERLAGVDADAVAGSASMLYQFSFEDRTHWRFRHPTDGEATDQWMAMNIHLIEAHIRSQGRVLETSFHDAFENWRLTAQAREGDTKPLEVAPPENLIEVVPRLVDADPESAEMLDAICTPAHDLWSLSELAIEVARLWGDLPRATRERLLTRMLNDRAAMGTYAVLEACLYLQKAVADEVWSRVTVAMSDLMSDPTAGREVSLCMDALLWRPPPDERLTRGWADEAAETLRPDSEEWGLVRFVAGFHQQWIPGSFLERHVAEDSTTAMSKHQVEYATWLIRWHFMHQARARSLLARQPLIDKDYLCRSPRREGGGRLRQEPVTRLVRSMLKYPGHLGWAVVLASACAGFDLELHPGDPLIEILRAGFPGTKADDQGLVAASLTYPSLPGLAEEMRLAFRVPRRKNLLLASLVDGVEVDGTRIRRPRFLTSSRPVDAWRTAGIAWPKLERLNAQVEDPMRLVEGTFAAVQQLVDDGVVALLPDQLGAAAEKLRRASLGDMRELERLASARKAAPDEATVFRHLASGIALSFGQQELL